MRPSLLRSTVAGLAFLAACGGGSLTDPRPIVGTYTLQTVNGQMPPQPLSDSETDIIGGRISLDPQGMVHQEMDLRTTSTPAGFTVHFFGTYSRVGNRIIVNWNDGVSNSMTLSGSTVTHVREGLTLVYRR